MASRKNGGFSLIELIVVIGILAVVAAVAAPSFTKYRQNANLKEVARSISSDIAYWKQRSSSDSIDYMIRVNAGANSYTVYKKDGLGAYQKLSSFDATVTDTKYLAGISSQVTIQSITFPSSEIYFQTRGTISPGGTIRIGHTARASYINIIVSTVGRIRIDYDNVR